MYEQRLMRETPKPTTPSATKPLCALSLSLSVPSLPFAFLPPRSQSSAAAPARCGERARDEQPAPERAVAAALPVISEKLELNTLKELLAQNLTELDQITRQMRSRHLNPGSAVVAAAASSRVPGPSAAYPPLSVAGCTLLEQLESRAEAAQYDSRSSPIARRTNRSSPRRGTAPAGAAAAAGAPLGATASLDFDSSAELTRVSSDFELPEERSSPQRSPLRPLPAELNSGASTLRWDDELEGSPRSSRKSSPRKHHHYHNQQHEHLHHHEAIPTSNSSPLPTSGGDGPAVGSSPMSQHMLPFMSSHHPVASLAQFPTGTNLTGGSRDNLPLTRAPNEGESDGDAEGDGNGEYDTTESRILNEDPHSLTLTLTSTLDAGFNAAEAPSVQPVRPLETTGAREYDEQRDEHRPTDGLHSPPAPEMNDELETLRELEEARRLKERIERLLIQCAEERAATSARSPRADPSLLGARSSPPPASAAPLRSSPGALTDSTSTSPSTSTFTSTAVAAVDPRPVASPTSAQVITSTAGDIITTASTLAAVSDTLTSPSKSSPAPGLQLPISPLASQVLPPPISIAPPPPSTTTPIALPTASSLAASGDHPIVVLPSMASPPPGVPLISATRRRLAEQFDADSDDGANDDALFTSLSSSDRGVSRLSPTAFAPPEFRPSRPPPPPPPPASVVAAAVSTARYMEQLSRIEAAIQARSVPRKSPPPTPARPSSSAVRPSHAAPSVARQPQLPAPDVARIENIFYGGSRPYRTPPRSFPEPSSVSLAQFD